MMRALSRMTCVAWVLCAVAAGAQTRENFLKVYQWETPQQGWAELTLWNTWVPVSDVAYERFDVDSTRAQLWAHSLEVEYGITDRLTIGAYADTENPPGGGFAFSRARIVGRYRLFDRYQYLFDTALYAEYYLPREAYGQPQELELRLILERDLGDFRIDLNPIVSKAMTGDEVSAPIEATLAAGVYWRRYWRVQPGIEIFAGFGGIGASPSFDELPLRVAPSVDVRLTQGIVWHLSAAIGVNGGTDRVMARSILSWEFETIRPSSQSH